MLKKVCVKLNEKDLTRIVIVETILKFYPYQDLMEKNLKLDSDEHRYTFLTDHRNIARLRHDLENLKICGFNVEEVRAL